MIPIPNQLRCLKETIERILFPLAPLVIHPELVDGPRRIIESYGKILIIINANYITIAVLPIDGNLDLDRWNSSVILSTI